MPEPAPIEATPAADPAPAPASEPLSSGVQIVVSLPLQRAYVFDGGELLWTAPVSTGKRGHETPVGTFPILQKKVHHRSSKYDDAPMPYMQRLTWYGIALHAGRVPGYPASHGCIRLPKSYARKLYALTDYGTTVTITREKPATAEDALDLA
jgi:lipoprotein-anchoring transpeptidase ErfK/SrfK